MGLIILLLAFQFVDVYNIRLHCSLLFSDYTENYLNIISKNKIICQYKIVTGWPMDKQDVHKVTKIKDCLN